MKSGYVQVYTGNGKGKTTAALGLTFRALGAGEKVCFLQFTKSNGYSEHKTGELFDNLIMEQYGTGRWIKGAPEQDDMDIATKGYDRAMGAVTSGEYGVVVLDEINIAVHYGLLTVDQVMELINKKAVTTELVLTGRYAHEDIIAAADLVTEMKEIKHYYKAGVPARDGIER